MYIISENVLRNGEKLFFSLESRAHYKYSLLLLERQQQQQQKKISELDNFSIERRVHT